MRRRVAQGAEYPNPQNNDWYMIDLVLSVDCAAGYDKDSDKQRATYLTDVLVVATPTVPNPTGTVLYDRQPQSYQPEQTVTKTSVSRSTEASGSSATRRRARCQPVAASAIRCPTECLIWRYVTTRTA